MLSSDKEKFEEIVKEFSFSKLDYNIEELRRIKERANEILGICLIVISIVLAIISQPDAIDKLAKNYGIFGFIEISGFVILTIVSSLCYLIMTEKVLNPIIDPQKFYEKYTNTNLEESKEILRDTMFDILNTMDENSDKYHYKLWRVYRLTAIGILIIFIPVIAILLIK